MKKIERISNVIHEAVLSSFWIRMINRSSVKKLDNSVKRDCYEISLHLSFSNIITEGLGLSEFNADINAVIKAIESVLIPKLDSEFCFVSKVKEVKRSEFDVEIVVLCESVV